MRKSEKKKNRKEQQIMTKSILIFCYNIKRKICYSLKYLSNIYNRYN